MDMYRDSYVVALMVDGKVQKESQDGTILLPFGSEYVIRLKNKLRKRAVADVWIDGKASATGIVIDANGTVDLERFVDGTNLSEGKKFKLARLTDPKVDQPNDSENGNIEVNFYPEKDEPAVEKKIIYDYKPFHNHLCNGHCNWCCTSYYCNICRPGIVWCSTATYGTASASSAGLSSGSVGVDLNSAASNSGPSVMPMNMNAIYTASADSQVIPAAVPMNAPSIDLGEAAATVEGSTSLQKFSSIYIDVDRSKVTTIRLTVKGVSKVINVCSCGFKRKQEKYCPNDGNQLVA